jgi:putative oxidoreductase
MSDREKTLTDLGLLILRVVLGVTFILHGLPKIYDLNANAVVIDQFADNLAKMNIPAPMISAWLAAGAEVGGGLLVIAGLLPRLGALAIAAVMAAAIVKVHWQHGFFLNHFLVPDKGHGYEYALNLLAMALAIVCTGAGKYSLAGLLRKGNGD